MSILSFKTETHVGFGLCEDGIFAEDDNTARIITWEDLFFEAVDNYADENGFIAPGASQELLNISAKLRTLATRLDELAARPKIIEAE